VNRLRLERAARLGYDAAKRINGHKHHFLVDCLRDLLAMHVADGAAQGRGADIDLIHPVRRLFP
jgi:hypothetical protein